MSINKTIIISFLVGIFASAFFYQIYINYQFRKLFSSDHTALIQVIDFINKNTVQEKPKVE